MKFFFVLLFINFFLITNAKAYIDPGSGSIILQALLGALAAAGATISIYWNKIKDFFRKNKKPENNKKEN